MGTLGWIGIALTLVVVACGAWVATLPAEATATRTATLPAPPEAVFARVADPAGQPAWRSDLQQVSTGPDGSWTETTRRGIEIRFREQRREPATAYDLAFESPSGFQGHWQGRFRPAAGGTEVTFTETVRIEARLNRALARLFAPPGAHIDLYLADLRRSLPPPR
jgi:uncharacterized protein YndB with AHSA1/START domain